jgi:hypothetical protein
MANSVCSARRPGIGPASYGGVAASSVFEKPQVGTPNYELGISSPINVNPAPAVHGTPF